MFCMDKCSNSKFVILIPRGISTPVALVFEVTSEVKLVRSLFLVLVSNLSWTDQFLTVDSKARKDGKVCLSRIAHILESKV